MLYIPCNRAVWRVLVVRVCVQERSKKRKRHPPCRIYDALLKWRVADVQRIIHAGARPPPLSLSLEYIPGGGMSLSFTESRNPNLHTGSDIEYSCCSLSLLEVMFGKVMFCVFLGYVSHVSRLDLALKSFSTLASIP